MIHFGALSVPVGTDWSAVGVAFEALVVAFRATRMPRLSRIETSRRAATLVEAKRRYVASFPVAAMARGFTLSMIDRDLNFRPEWSTWPSPEPTTGTEFSLVRAGIERMRVRKGSSNEPTVAWFRGPTGKPWTLYHGTPWPGFTGFNSAPPRRFTANETASLGVWLSSDRKVAANFAVKVDEVWRRDDARTQRQGEERGRWQSVPTVGAVISARLRIRNPKVYTTEVRRIPASEEDLRLNKYRAQLGQALAPVYREVVDDPFEVMMDDRDAFALYIGYSRHGEAGRGFWRKRYIAYESDVTNRSFVEALKAEGHDGIWLKATKYDGVALPGKEADGRTPRVAHDVLCVFDGDDVVAVGRHPAPKRTVTLAVRDARGAW